MDPQLQKLARKPIGVVCQRDGDHAQRLGRSRRDLVRRVFERRNQGKTCAFTLSATAVVYRQRTMTPGRRRGQQLALADLIALSRTSLIIGTRFSSFSYVPAVWGDVPVIETGWHLRVIPWT